MSFPSIWFLWSLFLFWSIDGMGKAAPFDITGSDGRSLALSAKYWVEESSSKTDAEIFALWQRQEGTWKNLEKSNLGMNPVVHWFVLPITYSGERKGYFFLENDDTFADSLDLFIYSHSGQRLSHFKSGDTLDISLQSLPHYHPLASVALEAGEEYVLIYRLQTLGTIVFQPKIWSFSGYFAKSTPFVFWMGLYLGLILMMIIYHGFMYHQLREQVNLSYLIYLLATGVFQLSLSGLGHYLFWPESSFLSNIVPVAAAGLGTLAATEFTVIYLGLKGRRASLDLFILCLKVSASLVILLSFVLSYDLALKFANVVGVIGFTFFLVSGFMCSLQGSKIALYFSFAWFTLVAGMIVLVARNFGFLPSNSLTMASAQIGSAIEIILLSLGIVARIQEERRQKIKAMEEAEKVSKTLHREVKTRFHLASELAHRLNNPLNYIGTGALNLKHQIDDLEQKTSILLSGDDPELDPLRESFQHEFEGVQNTLESLQKGVKLSTLSVREIKILSGIEGIDFQDTNIAQVWQVLWTRLRENLSDTYMNQFRFDIDMKMDQRVFVNIIIFVNVVEHLLRQALNIFADQAQVRVTTEEKVQILLCVDMQGAMRRDPQELQSMQDTYGHILLSAQMSLEVEAKTGALRVRIGLPRTIPDRSASLR